MLNWKHNRDSLNHGGWDENSLVNETFRTSVITVETGSASELMDFRFRGHIGSTEVDHGAKELVTCYRSQTIARLTAVPVTHAANSFGSVDLAQAVKKLGVCAYEYLTVAYSCKQRCTCPSCHQKRTLLTAIHAAEDVCFPVAHRQVVFTMPKRLRIHARFDRKLLGKLSTRLFSAASPGNWALSTYGPKDIIPFDILVSIPTSHAACEKRRKKRQNHPAKVMLANCLLLAVAKPGPCSSSDPVYQRPSEIDPMVCSQCGGEMKVVSFLDPPQGEVIEKILNGHQSGAMVGRLWQAPAPRAPPDMEDLVLELDAAYSDSSIGFPHLIVVTPKCFWKALGPTLFSLHKNNQYNRNGFRRDNSPIVTWT